ncbi:hypothetical protein A4X03_0g9543, partial [Tilletia caries]
LSERLAEATDGAGRIEIDKSDRDAQTLLVWYPSLEHDEASYIKPAVRIESGAKSALDPNSAAVVTPYVAEELPDLDLAVTDVTTIDAERTFWDKIVIAHGLRNWFDRRGVLKNEGQRISRHYYDLHCLADTTLGREAVTKDELGADCGAFDSRGGPMKNGIKLLADDTYGRVEISNRKEFKHFNLRPSKKAVEEIERLEELTLAAEQRLGNFVVGSNRG